MYSEVDPRAVALLEESISAFLPDDYAVAADPSFRIKPRNPFKGMPSDVLKDQMEFDYRPEDLQKYYDKINRPGPKLPLAYEEPAEYYMDPRTGQLMATIPSGPNTPLPTPGWNPSMIKPPGNPNFRPTPTYDRIGPNGERIPYGPLV
jgi:hypothetical protein